MKCLLVEDAPDAMEYLRQLIAEEFPKELQIIGEAGDLALARALIETKKPDLVFFDIEMRGGNTSFDLLRALKQEGRIQFDIIFVTAHGRLDYAVKALEYAALDYVTKPIERDKFRQAVEAALERNRNLEQYLRQLDLILETGKSSSAAQPIAIPLTRGTLEVILPNEIAWLESRTEITHIHLQNGDTLKAMRNIGYFSRMLIPDFSFFQVSQSAIVYLPYIRRYDHHERKVILKNGQTVQASTNGGRELHRHLTAPRNKGSMQDLVELLKGWFRKGR